MAISMAPVSEPGTIPMRHSSGSPRSARERSSSSWIRASGSRARWDLPSNAPERTSTDHPGRLGHGPEEKSGLSGRTVGFMGGTAGPGDSGSDRNRPFEILYGTARQMHAIADDRAVHQSSARRDLAGVQGGLPQPLSPEGCEHAVGGPGDRVFGNAESGG